MSHIVPAETAPFHCGASCHIKIESVCHTAEFLTSLQVRTLDRVAVSIDICVDSICLIDGDFIIIVRLLNFYI